MRKGQLAHPGHDELLIAGQKVAHHVTDHIGHQVGVEDAPRQREQQHDEGKQRQNDLCGHTEGVGVHLGLAHVVGKRLDLLPGAALINGVFNGGGHGG